MTRSTCPSCDSSELYEAVTTANGGYGPALLPGLGAFLKAAEMTVLLCRDCGHMSLFVASETLKRLPREGSKKFRRLRNG